MGTVIAVAIGGAVGSVLRYLLSKYVQKLAGLEFPVGTLFVNLLGAFLIGIAFSYLVEKLAIHPFTRALLITGFLGGFTTFSTFSYESYSLLAEGEYLRFLLYIFITNGAGILGTFLGFNLGRLL
ncbi:fluoride efflux transporter CrcB [Aquifex sp.]